MKERRRSQDSTDCQETTNNQPSSSSSASSGTLSLCLGPAGPLAPLWPLRCRCRLCSWPGFSHWRAPVSARNRFVLPRLTSRPEQLRRLAAQLASLASLEDVATHGLQSLLESPAGLAAPIPVDERALPASLSRPRSRSPLLQKRSQPAPRLHPAQPARSHWPGCQELSSCSPQAPWLLPSPLELPGICCRPW